MDKPDEVDIRLRLPKELVDFLDRLAGEWWMDRSRAVAELLKKERESRFELLVAEGYINMAAEDVVLAEEALSLAREVILRDDENDQER